MMKMATNDEDGDDDKCVMCVEHGAAVSVNVDESLRRESAVPELPSGLQ